MGTKTTLLAATFGLLMWGCSSDQWEGLVVTSTVPYHKDYGRTHDSRGKFVTYADCEKAMITAAKQVGADQVTTIPDGYMSRNLDYYCKQGDTRLVVRSVSFLLPAPKP
jgi:hypothetical protein